MPRENESGLTPEIIEFLRVHDGLNQNQIAERFGVSRQYVSKVKRSTDSFTRSQRELVMQHFPWQTGEKFNEASPNRRLRDHAEYQATNGMGMSKDKLKRLRSFYRKLIDEHLVIEFDPTIPPIPGVSSVGGFAYRKRQASDDDLMIRMNQYTNLSEEGLVIWRLPDKLPEV